MYGVIVSQVEGGINSQFFCLWAYAPLSDDSATSPTAAPETKVPAV
jgi:hypothetical protein